MKNHYLHSGMHSKQLKMTAQERKSLTVSWKMHTAQTFMSNIPYDKDLSVTLRIFGFIFQPTLSFFTGVSPPLLYRNFLIIKKQNCIYLMMWQHRQRMLVCKTFRGATVERNELFNQILPPSLKSLLRFEHLLGSFSVPSHLST